MTSAGGGFFAKMRSLARRLDPLPDLSRPFFRPSPGELFFWLLSAAVTLRMVRYHEPWRDEAQGYLVVRDNTLPGLVRHMKYESQFLLWYLLTWPLVRLCGMSIFGVALLHWAVSCCTAFMVLRRAPFRLLTRAALIFGIMFAFEFTVVARHYAIGLFLLALLMVNWRSRFRHPVLYACGIALCASSNLPVWACLGGLCVAIGYEAIARRLWSSGVIVSVVIVFSGFVVALCEIFNGHGFGSPYVSYRGDQLAGFDIAKRFRDAFDAISNLVYLPAWVWGVCLLLGFLYFAWKSVSAFFCFQVNAILMIALQFVGGFHSMRHVGFLLVGTVVSCWIAAQDEDVPNGFLARLPRRAAAGLAAAAGCAAALLLFLHMFLTPFFVWMEMKYPFSHGRATSFFIRDNIPEDVPMYCLSARSNVSVLPWLPGRQFFIFDRRELGTFSKWGRVSGLSMLDMALEAAARLRPDQRYALFVVAMNEDPNIFPANMILLYDSRQNERRVWGPYIEEFLVFAVVREEEKDLYRPSAPRNRPWFIPEDVHIREAPADR